MGNRSFVLFIASMELSIHSTRWAGGKRENDERLGTFLFYCQNSANSAFPCDGGLREGEDEVALKVRVLV